MNAELLLSCLLPLLHQFCVLSYIGEEKGERGERRGNGRREADTSDSLHPRPAIERVNSRSQMLW